MLFMRHRNIIALRTCLPSSEKPWYKPDPMAVPNAVINLAARRAVSEFGIFVNRMRVQGRTAFVGIGGSSATGSVGTLYGA